MPQMPLYIIPTGLIYGNFFRFRSTVRVQIGEPINVGKFIAEHSDLSQQEQMNKMKDLLTKRIHSTILYIPNDENYNATYEICNIMQGVEIKELLKDKANKRKHSLNLQLKANNKTLKHINELKRIWILEQRKNDVVELSPKELKFLKKTLTAEELKRLLTVRKLQFMMKLRKQSKKTTHQDLMQEEKSSAFFIL